MLRAGAGLAPPRLSPLVLKATLLYIASPARARARHDGCSSSSLRAEVYPNRDSVPWIGIDIVCR